MRAPWLSQLCLPSDDSIQIRQPLPRHAQPSEGESLESDQPCCLQRASESPDHQLPGLALGVGKHILTCLSHFIIAQEFTCLKNSILEKENRYLNF